MLGGGSPSSCRRMKKLEEEEGMAGGAAAQVAAPSPGMWRRVYGASGWAGPEPVGRDVPHPASMASSYKLLERLSA